MKGSVIYFRQKNFERRTFFRKNIVVDVTIKMGGHTYDSKTSNISSGGIGVLAIDSFKDLTLGELQDLRSEPVFIHFKDNGLDIRGELAWINCEDYHAGFVVRDISDGDKWDDLCSPDD